VGALPPGTYENVRVPPGASCRIGPGTIVTGNVIGLENSLLIVQLGSTVGGNVEVGRGGRITVLNNTTVEGNVKGSEAFFVQVDLFSTVGGNVQADKTRILVLSRFSTVGGNIKATEGANDGYVIICNVTLPQGNIVVEKYRDSDIRIGGGPVCVTNVGDSGNTLEKGSIKVEDNKVGGNQLADDLTISNNRVAENLQVFKNFGTGKKQVVSNTVGEKLECFENTDPFVGGPNVAEQAQGQCFATPPAP
jgi:hypothetical protein